MSNLLSFEKAIAAMNAIENTTAVAIGHGVRIVLDMQGECEGCYIGNSSTAVRKTTKGLFAVVNATPNKDGSYRLINLFDDRDDALRYNNRIHKGI